MKLDHNQLCRLAAETGYNLRTVMRWAHGQSTSPSTRINCEAVAKALFPEEPKDVKLDQPTP